MITINQELYNKMPEEVRSCFNKLPNPSSEEVRECFPETTTLKPAHEPICMARKPLSEKSVAENCLKWGTGGINIDESRVGVDSDDKNHRHNPSKGKVNNAIFGNAKSERGENLSPQGRFPANLITDGSEEVRECFPETKPSKKRIVIDDETLTKENTVFETSGYKERFEGGVDDNGGNASRFFKSIIYQAKASKSERNKGCEDLYILKDNIPAEDIDEIKHLLSI